MMAMENAANRAGDFAYAEAPATIREWILWEIVYNTGMAALFSVLAATTASAAALLLGSASKNLAVQVAAQRRIHDDMKSPTADYSHLRKQLDFIGDPHESYDVLGYRVASGVLSVVFVVLAILALNRVVGASKAYLAPRVVVVERIAEIAHYGR